MKMRTIIPALIVALCFGLMGCDFGEVEQGRCVAYDAANKKVTVVLDVAHDMKHPKYTGGVVEYLMPEDPKEIGPEPVPGGRVMFDLDKGLVYLYTADTTAIDEVKVEFVDKQKMKANDKQLKGKKFPIIDKANNTVQEYSKRLEMLVTFKVPADYIDSPDATWEAGDEVRLYYKENAKHQALRFMNISKTNIYKR